MKLNFQKALKPAIGVVGGYAGGLLVQQQLDKMAQVPQWAKDYGTGLLGVALAAGLGGLGKVPMATELGLGMIAHNASKQLPRLLKMTPSAPAPAAGVGLLGGYSPAGLQVGLSGQGRYGAMPPRQGQDQGDSAYESLALLAAA
jgi:hypothetical protein